MYKIIYVNLIKNDENIRNVCKQILDADLKIKTNYIDPVTEINDLNIRRRIDKQKKRLGIK